MHAIQARYRLLWSLKPLNAVYQADFQRLGWPHTQHEFSRFTAYFLLSMIVVVVVLSGIEQFILKTPANPLLFYALLVVNLFITIAADFYVVISTMRFVNEQIDAGLWADLHLQGLSPLEIVHTKYEIACLRIRWLLIAIQLLRMSPYLFLIAFAGMDILVLRYISESRWWIGMVALLGLPFWILFVR